MVLESYTLGTLREQIRREFGVTDTGATNDMIDAKINQAQAWIVGRRDWTWLRKTYNIDASAALIGSADVIQGSRNILLDEAISSVAQVRDIISVSSSSGDQTDGYMIESMDGATATVDSQYKGSTSSGVSVRLSKGYFELPEDFLRGESLVCIDQFGETRPVYRAAKEFDFIRRNTLGLRMRKYIYTVMKDPLNESDNSFLAVYPYIGSLTSLQFNYTRTPQKLVDSQDKSIIPVNDRIALFYAGAWFYAQSIGNAQFQFYRDSNRLKIEDMLKHTDLVDEDENRSVYVDEEAEGFLRGPSNYPDFNG